MRSDARNICAIAVGLPAPKLAGQKPTSSLNTTVLLDTEGARCEDPVLQGRCPMDSSGPHSDGVAFRLMTLRSLGTLS